VFSKDVFIEVTPVLGKKLSSQKLCAGA